MLKFSAIIVLALAICIMADPIRQRPLRRPILARQQVQPTLAPTGYPPAGLTPETPFELPTETEKPDVVYGPPETATQVPDEVYGPPETEFQQPEEIYGPPESKVQQPDEVYGPPEGDVAMENINEIDEEDEVALEDLDEVEEEVAVDENGEVVSARLVFQSRQPSKAVPVRLTKAKLVKPTGFVYTTRFQRFPKI